MDSNIIYDAFNSLSDSSSVAWSLDAFIKSTIILGVFTLSKAALRKHISFQTQYLLSFLAFMSLAVLPFSQVFVDPFFVTNGKTSSIFELNAFADNSALVSDNNWKPFVLGIYFVPIVLLLTYLSSALLQLHKLKKKLRPCTDVNSHKVLAKLQSQAGLSRKVRLYTSHNLETPISFGLLSPAIVLPVSSSNWHQKTLDNVLLHELTHIRRLDWIALFIVYVIACVYWMNPMTWIMLKKFRIDTESACDESVLMSGQDSGNYAESLLTIARETLRSTKRIRPHWASQAALERSTLKNRVIQIMEHPTMKKNNYKSNARKATASAILCTAALLTALASSVLVSAQSNDAQSNKRLDIIPLNQITPLYPSSAANEKIEGWVHVSFTVLNNGDVDTDSVKVMDAEPAGIFDSSAIAAARQFKFSKPTIDMVPVSVPNVQYVFRYHLAQDSKPDIRQPSFR
ncbi:MAG: M56 family metallopeptidase [Pseudohongiellaceae bacterium]|nr:M56 family metallopeptidase [Pseudohongiellaceae bacterium]